MHCGVEGLVHGGLNHAVLGAVEADMNGAVHDLGHLHLDFAVGRDVQADVDCDVVGVGHLDGDVGALGHVVGDVDSVALGGVLNHFHHLILGLVQAVGTDSKCVISYYI